MSPASKGRRLDKGGAIDRTRPIPFHFNGRVLTGYQGDTLASALLANGVGIIGRSLKYHRPRGIFGVGVEDPDAILGVQDAYGYDPAIRAGEVQLVEGLKTNTLRGWPSAKFDLGAFGQVAAPVLAAGFYYKTFMWPRWSLFEPMIQACTGFGRPSAALQLRSRSQRHDYCDVLIVGAGAAGLAAAHELQGSGRKVVIADGEPRPGGRLCWENSQGESTSDSRWLADITKSLEAAPEIEFLFDTTVVCAYTNNLFVLEQKFRDERGVVGHCLWKLRARQVVIATGALERPLVFQNNDRPGILLASAAHRLINEYGVAPCDRLAVYTNNDSAYPAAFAASQAGLRVPAIVDTRPRDESEYADIAVEKGIPCEFESHVVDTQGYKGISGITIARHDGSHVRKSCSGLAVSGGGGPLIHLAAHVGTRLHFDRKRNVYMCENLPNGWHLAGTVAGLLDTEAVMASGQEAAKSVLEGKALVSRGGEAAAIALSAQVSFTANGTLPAGDPRKMWVDRQNDVKVSDIDVAVQENYTSIEHLKRYTTLGMGTDQGRTSNMNGAAILAEMTGQDAHSVGTTTFRPPYSAIKLEAFAHQRQGDLYQPRLVTPIHDTHKRHQAVFADFGWERPDWYASNGGDREPAVAAEMLAVRSAVGIFDTSPLGKIEIVGPDAAEFLDRFYITNLHTLKPRAIRYSLMLREEGGLLDDGVVTHVAPNHYLVGTTSSNADAVIAWLERWHQTEWPQLRVAIVPVTHDWATLAIAGPQARELLGMCASDFDISADAFPHMAFREGSLGGNIPTRTARVSYTGELQYEVSVPACHGEALFQHLYHQGAAFGVCMIGMEAWLRLRLEKGYLHLGSDTNSRTIPDDIGMGRVVRRKRADFIGKRSLALPEAQREDREQLVGLWASDPLEVGGRILQGETRQLPCPTGGYVTSACYSPALGGHIGLGLVERGRDRHGEKVRIYSSGRFAEAVIGAPGPYDPTNKRLQA